jgi:hypothetical protein
MNNKFKITLLIGIITVMGGSIWSEQQTHSQIIQLKLQKLQKVILQLPMEQAMLVHTLTQHIL